MALASVLRAELSEFSPNFPKSFPKRFLEDFAEDSEGIPEILRDPPGPPRVLAAPPWGLEAEPEGLGLHILHGTTTLAFKTPLGVTVAVDSRATAGSYIASQAVRKAAPLGGRMLGTMAGGAADCAFWQRLVARQCRVQELRNKEPYKGLGLSMGTMLCAWDKRGPGLYYVDSEGQRVAGAAFAVGSGASYAFGVLDRGLAEAPGSEAAACGLARRAVYQAARRDAYSGGSVRVFHVGPQGWREVSHDDVADLQDIYGE
ncbi:Proteasome subunit beta type-5 [Lonchura striata]|uniref:Proteasome subunit beta type-5 n=1 Tax=Lonchura striata TaxID=40157 RepID=A0A218U7Z7_9PASE|nr:Proteasome subunit beta type-5 [Lonchura striata domestica]